MSISIGYFFQSNQSLSAVASNLHLWLGCDLQPYEGDSGDLYCRFLGMELSLWEHDFLDEGELFFSQYRYYLSIKTPLPDIDFRPFQLTVMLSIVYVLHRRLNLTGMLVFELQNVLARYEERVNEQGHKLLFDQVSAQWVKFPEHFSTIAARVPSGVMNGRWESSIDQYLQEQGDQVEAI